jgi:hypothetical protein
MRAAEEAIWVAAPQDLGWLATEFLASGMVLALIAFACIMVPVRLAASSRADGRPPGPALI